MARQLRLFPVKGHQQLVPLPLLRQVLSITSDFSSVTRWVRRERGGLSARKTWMVLLIMRRIVYKLITFFLVFYFKNKP
jgi:hypothetical protein